MFRRCRRPYTVDPREGCESVRVGATVPGDPTVVSGETAGVESGMTTTKPTGPTRGTLPAEMTSFVGRRRELTETRRLLASTRMLTLTGVGGVGKTRLALRMA